MIKRWSNIQKYQLLFRFLIPYIIILIIASLIAVGTYRQTLHLLEQETLDNNLKVLSQSISVLDSRFAEIESIVQQIVLDSKVLSFQYVTEPFAGANTYRILNTKNGLQEYGTSNHFLLDYFILFKNSQLVVSPDKVYTFDKFYEQVLSYQGISYEDWKQQFTATYHPRSYIPAREATYKDEQRTIVTYTQSLGYPAFFNGTVVALIDQKEIQKALSGINTNDGGFAYVMDKSGQMISSVGEQSEPIDLQSADPQKFTRTTIQGKDMMMTYLVSKANGWTYVAAQPTHIVLQKVNEVNEITVLLLVVSLVIGILIVFYLSYRNSRPIGRLVSMITENRVSDTPMNNDVFGYIRDSFALLLSSNKELGDKMTAQFPYVKAAVLDRLFKGGFHSIQDIEITLQHIGMKMAASRYCVILLHLSDHADQLSEQVLEELDIKRILIRDIVEARWNNQFVTYDVEEDKMVLLYMGQQAQVADCKRGIESLLIDLQGELQLIYVQPRIAVGGISNSLMDVSRSYEEANQALFTHMDYAAQQIVWFEQIRQYSETYYFPSDLEIRLIGAVKSGNKEELKKVMEMIKQKNFGDMSLSFTMERMLLLDLWGSLLKLRGQIELSDDDLMKQGELEQRLLEAKRDVATLLDSIQKELMRLCNYVGERKKSHNVLLIERILHYIQQYYAQQDMSLTLLSGAFGASEAYLSSFFKEQTGANFSDYLEDTRMSAAMLLLNQSSTSINEIADRIGYNSLNSFSRAFKRKHGVSATEYKRIAAK